VQEEIESIPSGNVSFMLDGYRFETETIDGTMVKRVIVTRMKNKPKDEE
jgi:CBS domain containing-hemolysin-like protein